MPAAIVGAEIIELAKDGERDPMCFVRRHSATCVGLWNRQSLWARHVNDGKKNVLIAR
jgi:hypothetical protein